MFPERDETLQLVTQKQTHHGRSTNSRGSLAYMNMRETSFAPISVTVTDYDDPVRNVAIQNPIAQPGGGAVSMQRHHNDVAELSGVMDRRPRTPVVQAGMHRSTSTYNFAGVQVTPGEIQDYYFNAGTRIDGSSLYVKNNDRIDNVGTRSKHDTRRKMRHTQHHKGKQVYESNTVTYNGTTIMAQAAPVGSRNQVRDKDKKGVSSASYSNALPPKAVVSSRDRTTFLSY